MSERALQNHSMDMLLSYILFLSVSVSDFIVTIYSMTKHDQHNHKVWTSPEQATFLNSKIPVFLDAQKSKILPLFWPQLKKEWFDLWPEHDLTYPAPPSEPSAPLSTMGLIDVKQHIATRKVVSHSLHHDSDLKTVPSNYIDGSIGTPSHMSTRRSQERGLTIFLPSSRRLVAVVLKKLRFTRPCTTTPRLRHTLKTASQANTSVLANVYEK
jgi:hypothetical protein